jgi:hypothetical protein
MSYEDMKRLLPGRAHADWKRTTTIVEESQTPVFNPYSAGMWVIRAEDYLAQMLGGKWTWKKPILSSGGGKRIGYKWVGRKKKGSFMPPSVVVWHEYQKGPDSFAMEVIHYDGQGTELGKKVYGDVPIENLLKPDIMFGWMKAGAKKDQEERVNQLIGLKKTPVEEPKSEVTSAIDSIKAAMKAPSWHYPSWALPKKDLSDE